MGIPWSRFVDNEGLFTESELSKFKGYYYASLYRVLGVKEAESCVVLLNHLSRKYKMDIPHIRLGEKKKEHKRYK